MKDIRHIFFDLDHTLWDYVANSHETLLEMYNRFNLDKIFSGPEAFIKAFHYSNDHLWSQYNEGSINRDFIRDHRFKRVLNGRISTPAKLGIELSDYFMNHCSRKSTLIPGALKVLNYLKNKYPMSLITNGFNDSQSIKLQSAGLSGFFKEVITSETAGHRKPSPEIFQLALTITNCSKNNALMVGDNFRTDILGARGAGWKSIWYNPSKESRYQHDCQIFSLEELISIL